MVHCNQGEIYYRSHNTIYNLQTPEDHLLGIPNQRILSAASAAMFFRIMVKNSITQVNTTNPFSRKPRIIWMSKVGRTIFLMKKLEK
jgi:hypothetical protein